MPDGEKRLFQELFTASGVLNSVKIDDQIGIHVLIKKGKFFIYATQITIKRKSVIDFFI
ncbi:MAG: hypothetical protein GXO76_05790 [Calditrichaeota bacterium]|nr:hypothetical protein [Calditrichota bacterium]